MGVQKLSIALDASVAEAARAEADAAGVSLSAWLNDAAATRLKIAAGLAAVREFEAAFGAFTDEERSEARARVDDLLRRQDARNKQRT